MMIPFFLTWFMVFCHQPGWEYTACSQILLTPCVLADLTTSDLARAVPRTGRAARRWISECRVCRHSRILLPEDQSERNVPSARPQTDWVCLTGETREPQPRVWRDEAGKGFHLSHLVGFMIVLIFQLSTWKHMHMYPLQMNCYGGPFRGPSDGVSIAQVGQHGLGLRKVRAGEFAAQWGRRHRHHHIW